MTECGLPSIRRIFSGDLEGRTIAKSSIDSDQIALRMTDDTLFILTKENGWYGETSLTDSETPDPYGDEWPALLFRLGYIDSDNVEERRKKRDAEHAERMAKHERLQYEQLRRKYEGK